MTTPKAKKRAITFLTMRALFNQPHVRPLIARVARLGDLVVLYGASETFKTFLALDAVIKIALGIDWFGRATTRGPALYLAAEGVAGMRGRVEAWCIEHGRNHLDLDLQILPFAVQFMLDEEFVLLIGALKLLPHKPIVIVVDTLARHMVGGDENSAQHMGIFVSRCEQLTAVTGATVVVVHHTGRKSAAGQDERGSSALRCAADVMIKVKRLSDDRVDMVCDKAKDGLPFPPLHLRGKSVAIEPAHEGAPDTSLVMVAAEPSESRSVSAKSKPDERTRADQEDHGTMILRALAKELVQPVDGTTWWHASGLSKPTFYRIVKREVAAERVEVLRTPEGKRYRLTSKAAEYVESHASLSLTQSRSRRTDGTSTRLRQSQSHPPTPPSRGGGETGTEAHGSTSPVQVLKRSRAPRGTPSRSTSETLASTDKSSTSSPVPQTVLRSQRKAIPEKTKEGS